MKSSFKKARGTSGYCTDFYCPFRSLYLNEKRIESCSGWLNSPTFIFLHFITSLFCFFFFFVQKFEGKKTPKAHTISVGVKAM